MEEGSDGKRDQTKEAQTQDAWTKRLPIFDLVVGKPSCGFVLVPLFCCRYNEKISILARAGSECSLTFSTWIEIRACAA